MRKTFDRRIVPDSVIDFVRACQERIPCHLGGGAALAGVYLGHRMTGDIDLFVHDSEGMRSLVGLLPGAASDSGTVLTVLRDVGHLVRAQLEARDGKRLPPELDLGLAARKDSGIDPGVLAWLLAQFPTHPLPEMLAPLTSEKLEKFRDELAQRLRRETVT
jgi:hypothetical protein